MPKLVNRKTGKVYVVTEAELTKMKSKPGVMKAFRVTETEVPEAVKKLAAKKEGEK